MNPKSSEPEERTALVDRDFLADLAWWVETDRSTALRLLRLVEATLRDPFAGPGKPEALKHLLSGAWSRRLTQEHRLIYVVSGREVRFLMARYHY
ncbi:MAG: Txe/YoeB family addiction module toxin [Thermoanaerobaculia bacterium]